MSENKNNPAMDNAATEEPKTRLELIAEKSGKTVEELLQSLEERSSPSELTATADMRSTGSLSSNECGGFDPTGTEFLKGIWGN